MYAENQSNSWTQIRAEPTSLTLLSQGIQDVQTGVVPLYSLQITRTATNPAPQPSPAPTPDPTAVALNNPPTKLYAWLEVVGAILLLVTGWLAFKCYKEAMKTKAQVEA